MKTLLTFLILLIHSISFCQLSTDNYIEKMKAPLIKYYKTVNFDSLCIVTVCKINEYRKKNNLNELEVDNSLNKYSKDWSDTCIKYRNFLQHSNISKQGIKAENIHFSTTPFNCWVLGKKIFYTLPDETFNGWLKSEGHRQNMLKDGVTKIGLSVSSFYDGEEYRYYTVMVLK